MYQALYRKYRPLRFADVVGQKHITDTLRNQIASGRLSHAYLFTGTRGTGKTTCAKILARAVNCEHPVNGDPCNTCPACQGILSGNVLDVLEIDAASNNGVDNIRDIRDEAQYTPASVKKRVYIIDEVHMLSQGAFNALLKTLEEPPAHVLFILATTEIHKVPATILSRCQRFDFRRISADAIAARLLEVAAQEQIHLQEDGAQLIARLSDGAMRDALSMLDRTASEEAEIDAAVVSQSLGILGGERTAELMQAICQNQIEQAVALIGECYLSGRDLAGILDQLLGLIRDMLLVKSAQKEVQTLLSPMYAEQTVRTLAENCAASTLIAYTRIIQESLARMKNAANRRVEAELCILRLCTLNAQAYDSLGGRVEALEEKLKHGVPAAVMPAPAAAVPTQSAASMVSAPIADIPERSPEQEPIPETEQHFAPTKEPWAKWPALLARLTGKINTGTHTNLKLSATATLEGNILTIWADDDVTFMLANETKAKEVIVREASALLGEGFTVKIKTAPVEQQAVNDAVDAVVQNAKKNGIPVTQLETE